MNKQKKWTQSKTSVSQHKSNKTFEHLILSSICSMGVCLICLCCVTWSWFTSNKTTTVSTIKTANYSVLSEIKTSSNDSIESQTITNVSVSYSDFKTKEEYQITLTPNGTTKSGYCILQIDQKNYYTNEIPDSGLSFTYTPESDQGNISVTSYWGENKTPSGTLLKNGDHIGQSENTEETTTETSNAEITQNLTNLESDLKEETVDTEKDLEIELTPVEGYNLPESISVSGVSAYSYENGILSIFSKDLKKDSKITVTASGVKNSALTESDNLNSTQTESDNTTDSIEEATDNISSSTDNTADPIEKLTAGGNVLLEDSILILSANPSQLEGIVPQIKISKDTVLNLSEKKIAFDSSVTESKLSYIPSLIEVSDGASLTIEGKGEISAECGENNAYAVNVNNGELIINDGNFLGSSTAVNVQSGSVEINGGFFDLTDSKKKQSQMIGLNLLNDLLNIDISENQNQKVTIIIKGGTFVNINPSEWTNPDGTSYIAEGYTVTAVEQDNGDIWYCVISN